MRDLTDVTRHVSRREPWNKGKWIGEKPLLRSKHVWPIRTKLQLAGRTCDLAMFNLAIESKLRGYDVVRCGSKTLHLMVTRSTGQPCARRRRASQSGSR